MILKNMRLVLLCTVFAGCGDDDVEGDAGVSTDAAGDSGFVTSDRCPDPQFVIDGITCAEQGLQCFGECPAGQVGNLHCTCVDDPLGAIISCDPGTCRPEDAPDAGDDAGMDAGPDANLPQGPLAFVTSEPVSADFASFGLATTEADEICQTRATAASLPGEWAAWISDDRNDAFSRFPFGSGPWRNLNGDLLFMDRDEVQSLSAAEARSRGVTDEFGTAQTGEVWTGTEEPGLYDTFNACFEWTTTRADVNGRIGSFGSDTSGVWYDVGEGACDQPRRLLCLQRNE